MPDVMKMGGVTGWLCGAPLAVAAGVPVSSRLFPEISAHLLAAALRGLGGVSHLEQVYR